MFSLLLHNKYYKLLQCLPVDYAPILGKSNYFLSLPHKLMKSSLKKKTPSVTSPSFIVHISSFVTDAA